MLSGVRRRLRRSLRRPGRWAGNRRKDCLDARCARHRRKNCCQRDGSTLSVRTGWARRAEVPNDCRPSRQREAVRDGGAVAEAEAEAQDRTGQIC